MLRALICLAVVIAGCGSVDPSESPAPPAGEGPSVAEAVVAREIARVDSAMASIDSIFQPLPLLAPGAEAELRRFLTGDQLSRARALGVGRDLSPERLDSLRSEGRLVQLQSTEHWVVRQLDYSQPLVVPGVTTLLQEIGSRFHRRLAELGAPGYRLEITSVLRTAADQQALRRVNPNAAAGESTHEYGTTVDVLYSAYSAPARPILEVHAGEAAWLSPYLHHYAGVAAERTAARRSLELKAILGEVLLELQREGRVMVTLERQQPVYHLTLASE